MDVGCAFIHSFIHPSIQCLLNFDALRGAGDVIAKETGQFPALMKRIFEWGEG